MLRIHTAGRLHFGLLSLPDDESARRFGGVGMMVESPGIQLRVQPAESWSVEGPLGERALAFARGFERNLEGAIDRTLPPMHLIVEAAPREHVGLGAGTQLGMAVARILSESWGLNLTTAELARKVERGARSALGVHGFAHGGFLVDGGKRPATALAPLVARADFPPGWRVVLVLPQQTAGLHGGSEQAAFAGLQKDVRTTEALCRLVLLGLLPALLEEDLPTFGEALFEFNARVGEMFAPVQGGVYASPAVAELIDFFRRKQVAGVGQSSWGPGVFAVIEDVQAAWLVDGVKDFLGANAWEVQVTRGSNQGARIEDVQIKADHDGSG